MYQRQKKQEYNYIHRAYIRRKKQRSGIISHIYNHKGAAIESDAHPSNNEVELTEYPRFLMHVKLWDLSGYYTYDVDMK